MSVHHIVTSLDVGGRSEGDPELLKIGIGRILSRGVNLDDVGWHILK